MPIYEYQCQSCAHQMEALQKLSDPPLSDCPACGRASLKKKISAAGFRLKGSGWYETDFKQSNRKNLAGENKASGENTKSAGASGKDTQPGNGAKSTSTPGGKAPA